MKGIRWRFILPSAMVPSSATLVVVHAYICRGSGEPPSMSLSVPRILNDALNLPALLLGTLICVPLNALYNLVRGLGSGRDLPGLAFATSGGWVYIEFLDLVRFCAVGLLWYVIGRRADAAFGQSLRPILRVPRWFVLVGSAAVLVLAGLVTYELITAMPDIISDIRGLGWSDGFWGRYLLFVGHMWLMILSVYCASLLVRLARQRSSPAP